MQHPVRRQTRLIGSALLSIFVVVLSVTCMADAGMTDAEMACCASLTANCGVAMGQDHGCCQTEAPRFDPQLAASSRAQAPIPQPTIVAVLAFALPTELRSTSIVLDGANGSPPAARGVPTYLLISSLRI